MEASFENRNGFGGPALEYQGLDTWLWAPAGRLIYPARGKKNPGECALDIR
jgi:hypothetical protein